MADGAALGPLTAVEAHAQRRSKPGADFCLRPAAEGSGHRCRRSRGRRSALGGDHAVKIATEDRQYLGSGPRRYWSISLHSPARCCRGAESPQRFSRMF